MSLSRKISFIGWKIYFLSLFVFSFHFFYRKFLSKKYFSKAIPPLKKILLCNQGALGDVFLSTFLIPSLKKAYPGCQIGMLIVPYARSAVVNCPGVSWIHEHSHWLKVEDSLFKKIGSFLVFQFFQKGKMVKELASCQYDCAISLHPFSLGLSSLFLEAKIPIRIGFDILSFQQLFSHKIHWENGQYLPRHYWRLLKEMGIEEDFSDFHSPWTAPEVLQNLKGKVKALSSNYILFHIGSIDPQKELPVQFWRSLLAEFQSSGQRVYFTGKGERENQLIEQVCVNQEQNLCGHLNWEEFLQTIFRSQLVISVDTITVHVAAAMQKPCMVFYQERTEDPDLWRPNSSRSIAFIKKDLKLLPHVERKDANLIWVDTFDPSQVYAEAEKLLAKEGVSP